ncbi:hypothetical protein [Brevibacillus sp. NRS-1366]|uniref:hypothetical protein n=1 Tax=Brevibacillus sp. NRS-1366 TaxID=3233899 RepID=UPI003D236EDA
MEKAKPPLASTFEKRRESAALDAGFAFGMEPDSINLRASVPRSLSVFSFFLFSTTARSSNLPFSLRIAEVKTGSLAAPDAPWPYPSMAYDGYVSHFR